MLTVTLTINDDEQTHTIEPRTVLADLLRDRCGLTGTHLGCEHGACGACTLEVDGKATRSCVILAAMCEGHEIRTVESLERDGQLDPVQVGCRSLRAGEREGETASGHAGDEHERSSGMIDRVGGQRRYGRNHLGYRGRQHGSLLVLRTQ